MELSAEEVGVGVGGVGVVFVEGVGAAEEEEWLVEEGVGVAEEGVGLVAEGVGVVVGEA
jgi:hypothetical protein